MTSMEPSNLEPGISSSPSGFLENLFLTDSSDARSWRQGWKHPMMLMYSHGSDILIELSRQMGLGCKYDGCDCIQLWTALCLWSNSKAGVSSLLVRDPLGSCCTVEGVPLSGRGISLILLIQNHITLFSSHVLISKMPHVDARCLCVHKIACYNFLNRHLDLWITHGPYAKMRLITNSLYSIDSSSNSWLQPKPQRLNLSSMLAQSFCTKMSMVIYTDHNDGNSLDKFGEDKPMVTARRPKGKAQVQQDPWLHPTFHRQ